MDFYTLLVLGVGAIFVALAFLGLYAGIRRVQGRRTRFDGVIELFLRSQGTGVYPPSLRGNPDPLEQEVVEVSRGDTAVRQTPSDIAGRDRSNEDHAGTR